LIVGFLLHSYHTPENSCRFQATVLIRKKNKMSLYSPVITLQCRKWSADAHRRLLCAVNHTVTFAVK